MGLTLPEASKLTRRPFTAMVFKAIAKDDELAASIMFVPKAGTSFDYSREKALPSAAWIPDSGVTTEESTATTDRVTVAVRRLVGNSDIDAMAEELDSTEVSQTVFQLAKKGKAMFQILAEKMLSAGFATGHTLASSANPFAAISAMQYGPGCDSDRYGPGSIKYVHAGTFWSYRAPGDVTYGAPVACATNGTYILKSDNPNKWIKVTLVVASATTNGETLLYFTSSSYEPDGLNRLMNPAMVGTSEGTNGDQLSFALLDRMIDKVKVRERLAFIMPPALIRKFGALCRAMGGAGPTMLDVPGFNGQVPSYRGIPLLRSENIATNETKGSSSTLSSIYLVSLSEAGFWVAAGGGSSMNVEADPRERTVLGLRMEQVGTLEGKDAKRWRAKFYGAFALGSDLAAYRQTEVETAGA